MSDEQGAVPQRDNARQENIFVHRPGVVFLYSGLLFLFASLFLFGLSGFSLYQISMMGPNIVVPDPHIATTIGNADVAASKPTGDMSARDLYNYYGRILSFLMAPVLLIFSAIICTVVGIRLLSAAGAVTQHVIPPQDHELLSPAIRDGNDKAISEYIRLSSLSGVTGTFTKVGLTGLPLATIVLTMFLAILGVFNPKFYDLAQLTLGAFIGSYVQKQKDTTTSEQ
jgi:hypothetical protein